jgi:hypothetical protein
VNTSEKFSFMSSTGMGTNEVSKEALDAVLSDSGRAMESWMRNGTVPEDYIQKRLGNPLQAVIVEPTQVALPAKDASAAAS